MIEPVFLVVLFFGHPVTSVGPMTREACRSFAQEAANGLVEHFADPIKLETAPSFRGRALASKDVVFECAETRPATVGTKVRVI